MINRIAHLFPQDEPKAKSPKTKQPRTGKGKRLICRLTDDGGKVCIYVNGAGEYFIRGEKVTPERALRLYCIRQFDSCGDLEVSYCDKEAMQKLTALVLPFRATEPPEFDLDNEGDEWKGLSVSCEVNSQTLAELQQAAEEAGIGVNEIITRIVKAGIRQRKGGAK